jgi:hypothetical protein
MTNILLYIPPPYKASGGLGNFKLFFDICKKLEYSIYFCPLLKNIPSLNFNTPFNDRNLDSISDIELIDYYIKCPEKEVEYINPNDIVTAAILKARNNVVIYPEDVIGNPTQQEYVVRWLFYFPIPTAIQHYNFDKDYIWFYSDYIYNFYKYVCIACGIPDYLTKNLKEKNICRVFKFQPEMYKSIKSNRIINKNMNTNRKCFTVRKLFPPVSFDKFNKGVNIIYAKEIAQIHKNKIISVIKKIENSNNNIEQKAKYKEELNILNKNEPNPFSNKVIREFLTNKFVSMGYDHIEHKPSSDIFVNYFKKKDFFLSFDPFTFMSVIASLCGCISVIKKINGLTFKEWINGDPFNRYGIAYGQEGIEYALKTRHLLLDHITNIYYQNDNNVLNFITNIERRFNIEILRL